MIVIRRGRAWALACPLLLLIEVSHLPWLRADEDVADSAAPVHEVAACPSDVSAEVREAITRQSGEPLFMLQTEAGALRSRSAFSSSGSSGSSTSSSRSSSTSSSLPLEKKVPKGALLEAAQTTMSDVRTVAVSSDVAVSKEVASAAQNASAAAAVVAPNASSIAAPSTDSLAEADVLAKHVSQAKHLDLTSSNKSDSVDDLVFLSIMSNASVVAGSDGGSSWATLTLCCVFVAIVLCAVFCLSQSRDSRGSGQEVYQTTNRLPASSYLDKLGERKSMTNPDLSRAGSARKFASGPDYGSYPGGGSRPGGTAPILPERASTTGRPSFQPPTGRPSAASATPAPSITNARLIGGEEALPKLYPDLVMSAVRTRLAVPVAPLNLSAFEIDIVGMTGSPLLYAALGPRPGGISTMELSLSSDGKLLATVTPQNQILDGQGNLFVTLTQGESAQVLVRDTAGGVVMVLTPGSGSGEAVLLSQAPGGRLVERASLARRPPTGRLQAEHYEVFVAPGVDAVLSLACFMALVVFIIPNSS